MIKSDGNVRYNAWLRRNPPHPGGYIGDWMEDADGTRMTVIAAAARLGISQPALSRVINGRAGISTALALKLEAVGWGKADMWNRMQAHYDLVQGRNRIGQWPPDPAGEELREDVSEAA
ncbi:MAG: HigA family addiction module antitoxin [Bryobacterales bacterium]|nr:HigA family addiction module antitoxin [Bryobacterales bacterium]